MKILFDQGTPLPIRAFLKGHFVRTAFQEGWSALRNGDLIAAAEASGFHLLLSTDRNLRYQQNLSQRLIAILVIDLQQWPALEPYVHEVVEAVDTIPPGGFLELNLRRHSAMNPAAENQTPPDR